MLTLRAASLGNGRSKHEAVLLDRAGMQKGRRADVSGQVIGEQEHLLRGSSSFAEVRVSGGVSLMETR